MKTKNILIIAGAVILVLGVGVYFAFEEKTGKGIEDIAQQNTPKNIKDLISLKIPQKCTFLSTTEDNGTTSEGVIYAAGGKIREDVSSTVSGKTYLTHIIIDGSVSYMWTDEQKTGYKMKIDTEATPKASAEGETQNVDINKNFDFKCSAWVPDNSLFELPSGIYFTDLEAFTNPSQAPTSGQEGTSQQCAACNSLTGESKTQCLQALKCQ
jgi:hypothetical protein